MKNKCFLQKPIVRIMKTGLRKCEIGRSGGGIVTHRIVVGFGGGGGGRVVVIEKNACIY